MSKKIKIMKAKRLTIGAIVYDNEAIANAAVTMFTIAALVSMWGLFEAGIALGEQLESRRRQREYGKSRGRYRE
jgi:hypothetical protein